MASGKVALCCMDGEGKHVIGDVNTQSVLEIYNAPGLSEDAAVHVFPKGRRRALRHLHLSMPHTSIAQKKPPAGSPPGVK